MRVFLLLTYFISGITSATSCHIPSEQFKKWNEKYSQLIKLKVTKNANDYFVLATLPREIEGLKFRYVILHKTTNSNDNFSAQLATFEKDGELKTAYSSGYKRREIDILTVGFGKNCGIDVSVSVVFK